MKTALIVTTYNWPEALALVLKSIKNQKFLPSEVVIADDGSTNSTKEMVEKFQKNFPVTLIHSWHPDKGFRAAQARNLAVTKTTAEHLIFIDGDMILHSNFVKDHQSVAKPHYFTQGSRMLLSESTSQNFLSNNNYSFSFFQSGISNKKHLLRWSLLKKLSLSTKKDPLDGIRTCNFAVNRSDFERVNGFNHDFKGWGREDSELVIRLQNSGVKRQNLKFAANALHIYHKENSRNQLLNNDAILQRTLENKWNFCPNGLSEYTNI